MHKIKQLYFYSKIFHSISLVLITVDIFMSGLTAFFTQEKYNLIKYNDPLYNLTLLHHWLLHVENVECVN